MPVVNVYLPFEGRQILVLAIPSDDIKRFTYCPLKWIRFVTFAICGTQGNLSATPAGQIVDYDTHLNCISDAYYFCPDGDYQFIDYNALEDRATSSAHTLRSSSFRARVIGRDGPACVFTGNDEYRCEAVHLLPKNKGGEYVTLILQDRRHLYVSYGESDEISIDSAENGIFLRSDLHKAFGRKECAFLKTPNFALKPADVPVVEEDSVLSSRLTLHFLKPETSRSRIPQYDACITEPGTGVPQPSTLILDFVYGAAVYQQWGSDGEDIRQVLDTRFSDHFKSIPPLVTPLPNYDPYPEPDDPKDADYVLEDNGLSQLDDRTDGDYIPMRDTQQRGRRRELNMSDAMDTVLALSMLLKGTSPEQMAAERRRREEAEELRAKEPSRVRVEEWMENSSSARSGRDIEHQSNANDNLPPL